MITAEIDFKSSGSFKQLNIEVTDLQWSIL